MKQKRKENCSLHSSKQCLNAIGTVTLLGVVCGVLGIISVGLLTKSAIAAGEESTSSVAYTGVDDKVDVVVGLNFIDQNNQSKDLYNFYESGDNLYVTPNNLVVNVTNTNGEILRNNEVIGSVYGHVLGGEGNKLNSDNVTIIAGSSNEIGAGNTNAVLLGGTGNTMGGSEVLALVGGEGNDANKKEGLIIGGNNNRVNGGNGSASVLGGERNEVLGDNAVVGGLGIRMAQSLKNVFAYSNRNVGAGNFITKSSDAFYLDIQKGLGINLESNKGGVEMQGAMGFGEVDINQGCNDSSNNYGVQGTWNGCMVGCTKAGGGKWQLLDSSESCKAKCKDDSNGRCVVDVYNPSEVAGKCSDAKVSTMNAEICEGRNPVQYKDVIFETTLIDSEGNCNGGKLKNNQCVYKCKQGYHLTGDNTGIIKSNDERKQKGMGCYKDCTLKKIDGSNGKKVKHNATVWGYDVKSEQCAYNDDGVKSPASTYTCGDHYTQLLCVDGKFYKKSGGNWVDNSTTWYENCTLNKYDSCASQGYSLTKTDITGTYKDSTPSTDRNLDRKSFSLTRGQYYMCVNRKVGSNNSSCEPDKFYYKFKEECNSNYKLQDGYCQKKCGDVDPGGYRLFYKSSSVKCKNKCTSDSNYKVFYCRDGEWKDIGWNKKPSEYKYTTCSQTDGDNTCNDSFDLTSEPEEQEGKEIKSCKRIYAEGNSCKTETKWKLVDDEQATPDVVVPSCTGDQPGSNTKKGSTTPSSDKNWKYKATGTLGECEWSCKSDEYERDGNIMNCKLKGTPSCTGDQPGSNTKKGSTTPSSDKNWKYKATGTLGACEWSCMSDEYERDGNTMNCKLKGGVGYSCQGEEPSGKGVLTGAGMYAAGHTPTSWKYEDGKTQNQLKACEWSCEEGYTQTGNACMEIGNRPCDCKYGGDGPACSSNDGCEIINDNKQGDCGYKWQCKGSNGTTKSCSMSYEPSKLSVSTSETKNYLDFVTSDFCGQFTSVSEIQNTVKKYGSAAQCQQAADTSPRRRTQNYAVAGNSWSRGDPCSKGDPYCSPCYRCVGGGDITYSSSTTAGYCKIEGGNYSASDSRCAGLANICKAPKPSCGSYKTANSQQQGCNTRYTEEGGLNLEQCVSKMESKPWVTSQAYGYIKNGVNITIKEKGVSCDKYSPYCVPCLACECENPPDPGLTCAVTIKNTHYGSTAAPIQRVKLIIGGYTYDTTVGACGILEGQTSTCTFKVPDLNTHRGDRVWVEGTMHGCMDEHNCGYPQDILLYDEVGKVGSYGECAFSVSL